jgi:hypothetical protein
MKEKSLVSFKIKLLSVFGIVIIILAICAHLISNKIIRFYVEKVVLLAEHMSEIMLIKNETKILYFSYQRTL